MESLRIRVQPLSAFGSRPLGDMLFGQLCWAVRNRHGEASLAELLVGYTQGKPWAVVSDALPSGHVPRPSLPGHGFDAVEGIDRKAANQRAWLPFDRFHQPVETWLRYCLPGSALGGGLPEPHPQPHNTIDRTTGTTGTGQFAPYAMEQLWFGEQSAASDSAVPLLDIHVVLDDERMKPDALAQLFRDIGQFGFGRDAGIGLGKFDVLSAEPFPLPNQNQADAWLTLAPCAPQRLGFDAERSFYKPFTRFGRHGDIGVHLGNPFKTPVLLAQTGAVFSPRPFGSGPEASALFIGQGLGGDGSLSKSIRETVHQGYAPALGIKLPARFGATNVSTAAKEAAS